MLVFSFLWNLREKLGFSFMPVLLGWPEFYSFHNGSLLQSVAIVLHVPVTADLICPGLTGWVDGEDGEFICNGGVVPLALKQAVVHLLLKKPSLDTIILDNFWIFFQISHFGVRWSRGYWHLSSSGSWKTLIIWIHFRLAFGMEITLVDDLHGDWTRILLGWLDGLGLGGTILGGFCSFWLTNPRR